MSELREHRWAVLTPKGAVGGFSYDGALAYGRRVGGFFWVVTIEAVRRMMEGAGK